jgi:hypothetical protein
MLGILSLFNPKYSKKYPIFEQLHGFKNLMRLYFHLKHHIFDIFIPQKCTK